MAERWDDAFNQTCRLVLGRSLGPVSGYEEWLRSRIVHIKPVRSALGEGMAYLPTYSFFGYIPKSRIVSFNNMQMAAEKMIEPLDGMITLKGQNGGHPP